MPTFKDINEFNLLADSEVKEGMKLQVSSTQVVTLKQIADIAINKIDTRLVNEGYKIIGIDGFINGIDISHQGSAGESESSKVIDIDGILWLNWSFDAIYLRYDFRTLNSRTPGVSPGQQTPNIETSLTLRFNLQDLVEAIDTDLKPDLEYLSNFLLPSYSAKVGNRLETEGAILGRQHEYLLFEPITYLDTIYYKKVEVDSKFILYHTGNLQVVLDINMTGMSDVSDIILSNYNLVHVIPLGKDYIWRYKNQD